MFDYIFYRLYIFYNEKENGVTPISTAALYLSVLQILMVFCIYMIINISLHGKISLKEIPINSNYLKIGVVVAALILEAVNYIIYKRRYRVLIRKYRDHSLNRKITMWMIYVFGVMLFLLPFLYRIILNTFQ